MEDCDRDLPFVCQSPPLSSDLHSNPCPLGYIAYKAKCIKPVADGMPLEDANLVCASAGGHVMAAKNEAEMAFVKAVAQEHGMYPDRYLVR